MECSTTVLLAYITYTQLFIYVGVIIQGVVYAMVLMLSVVFMLSGACECHFMTAI